MYQVFFVSRICKMFGLPPLKLQWKGKKITLGISSCLFSRGRVSLVIHLCDVELYVSDWDICLSVTKLNTVIEGIVFQCPQGSNFFCIEWSLHYITNILFSLIWSESVKLEYSFHPHISRLLDKIVKNCATFLFTHHVENHHRNR